VFPRLAVDHIANLGEEIIAYPLALFA